MSSVAEGGVTWCSERQAVVQAAGFGGDEQVAQDAQGNNEGQENHCCHRQAHKGTQTAWQQNEIKQIVTSLKIMCKC